MEKINKKDKINLVVITVIFIGIIVFILRNNTLYGSILDWNTQHSVIPEYFRSLFYKTLNIFPDFALNLGSGQNIYNYSYYGLFNPVIIISYFFMYEYPFNNNSSLCLLIIDFIASFPTS